MLIRKQTQKWLVIILFFSTIIIDWLYTYSLMQAMSIITHWVILSPVLMTLFIILSLFVAGGLYLQQWWGYVGAYVILVLSGYFAFLSYSSHVDHSVTNFIALLSLNLVGFISVLLFEMMSWGNPPANLDD